MKRLFSTLFVFICLICFGPIAAEAEMAKSLSKFGITWYFDKEYEYGQFANDDYWVLGPVTITRISPDFDGTHNGWEVNPKVSGGHGFVKYVKNGGFDSSLVPKLPYKSPSTGIVSIVKTVGTGKRQPAVRVAAVLTIVTDRPPGNGTGVFRPPFVGNDKPYYHVDNLRIDLLPSFKPVGNPPTLDSVASWFRRPRLDYKPQSYNRSLRPIDAMENYQPKNSARIAEAALRLMLDDDIDSKMPALIKFVQAGIDKVHAILLGQVWWPADGHEPMHILESSFTATMLDIQKVKKKINSATFFHASKYLSSKTRSGQNLWGEHSSEKKYWDYIMDLSTSRSRRDPYGYIDGGKSGADYQLITSQSHKGEVLAANLMPVLKDAWPADDLAYAENYVERWVNHGTWAQPDPCAPYDGNKYNYGITFGPDPNKRGDCIKDPDLLYYNSPTDFKCKHGYKCGRFPHHHGNFKDGGQYRSDFVAAMWNAYYKKPNNNASKSSGKIKKMSNALAAPQAPTDLSISAN
jgi:hypothetical protein